MLPIGLSVFGPELPVFVYTQGTIPNRRTTAIPPELISDMAMVLKAEPNSCFFPQLGLLKQLEKEEKAKPKVSRKK